MLTQINNEVIIYQIDNSDRDFIENSVLLANTVQNCFTYIFSQEILEIDKKYLLKNGGYNLDKFVKNFVKKRSFSNPVVFITSLRYSGVEKEKDHKHSYYLDCNIFNNNSKISIISTYLWKKIFPHKDLQTFILLMLATLSLTNKTGITFHEEIQECLFDYYGNINNFKPILKGKFLCRQCTKKIEANLRKGSLNIWEMASIKRILFRAIDMKYCFIAMPFRVESEKLYLTIKKYLSSKGYLVIRADELGYPRKITDRIFLEILSSTLVLADITRRNPNVFYEIGVAHSAIIDVIMITQDTTIPFDVRVEQVIKYQNNRIGINKLCKKIFNYL